MGYNKDMSFVTQRGSKFFASKTFVSKFFVVLFLSLLCLSPMHVAHAQYVPVYDADVETAVNDLDSDFNSYVTDLFDRWDNTFGDATPDGTTDSLRDLIAGSDPQMIGGDCVRGDTTFPVFAYGTAGASPQPDWAPWMYAWSSSSVDLGGDLPNEIAGGRGGGKIQINTSKSLSCLLQEIVEWQKLGLSVQIHSLLKQFITDAQATQLTKQYKGKLNAAKYNFSKGGNEVNNNSVISNSPTFVTNYNQQIYNVNGRQVETAVDQAANVAGDPEGSMELCRPWALDVAASIAEDARVEVEDPKNYTAEATGCSLVSSGILANESDIAKFEDNFNDTNTTQGGMATFFSQAINGGNSSLDAARLAYEATGGRVAKQGEKTKADLANPGFTPFIKCPNADPTNPHAIDTECDNASPAQSVGRGVDEATTQMESDIVTPEADAQGSSDTAETSLGMDTNTGLAGVSTAGLETANNAANYLVQELYDSMDVGYFGISPDTTEWAQGTMLMIYDEMSFDQGKPNISVQTSGTSNADPDY